MIQAITEASADRSSFDGDGRAPAGAGATRSSQDPAVDEPVVVHRRRRRQRDAQQRADADQAEARSRSDRDIGRRDHPPPRRRDARSARHRALHAAGAGPDDRGPRLAARSTSSRSSSRRLRGRSRRGRRASSSGCRRCRSWPMSPAIVQDQGLQAFVRDRSRRRGAPRRHAGGDRHRALQRVRPAADFDDLHAVDPVPRGARRRDAAGPDADSPRSRAMTCRACRDNAPAGAQTTQVPLSSVARIERAHGRRSSSTTSAQFPSATVSFNLAPGASLGDAVDGDPSRRRRELGSAAVDRDELPGRGAGVPGVARQHAVADPRRGRHDVHRAGRALRELHPPGDDPVDAAVGGRRRAARAAADAATTSASSRSSASSC